VFPFDFFVTFWRTSLGAFSLFFRAPMHPPLCHNRISFLVSNLSLPFLDPFPPHFSTLHHPRLGVSFHPTSGINSQKTHSDSSPPHSGLCLVGPEKGLIIFFDRLNPFIYDQDWSSFRFLGGLVGWRVLSFWAFSFYVVLKYTPFSLHFFVPPTDSHHYYLFLPKKHFGFRQLSPPFCLAVSFPWIPSIFFDLHPPPPPPPIFP